MPALAGWLARRRPIYVHPSLAMAKGRGRGWREGYSLSSLSFHPPAPAGQRILQDIIRYAPKVDRWLLRSAKTSVPHHRENSLPQDSRFYHVISQRKKLLHPRFIAVVPTPAIIFDSLDSDPSENLSEADFCALMSKRRLLKILRERSRFIKWYSSFTFLNLTRAFVSVVWYSYCSRYVQ